MAPADLPGDPNVQSDKGVAVYRPFAGGAPNKARVGYAGNQAVLNGQGRYQGTKTKGSRHVIGEPKPPTKSRRSGAATMPAAKSSAGSSSKPKKTADDKGDGSASGSESDE